MVGHDVVLLVMMMYLIWRMMGMGMGLMVEVMQLEGWCDFHCHDCNYCNCQCKDCHHRRRHPHRHHGHNPEYSEGLVPCSSFVCRIIDPLPCNPPLPTPLEYDSGIKIMAN